MSNNRNRNRNRGNRPQQQRPNLASVNSREPVRISTQEPAPEVKQIELFSIDDRPYLIPEEFDPGIGLRYLRDLRDEGAEYATANLLTEVLGEEGLNDLAECRSVTKKQMAQIVDVITEMAMAAVDEGKD